MTRRTPSCKLHKDICASMLVLVLSAGFALAQASPANVTINNVKIQQDVMRFSAPGEIQALRVQIKNHDGKELFDSGMVAAASYDWNQQDQSDRLVPDGIYLAIISVQDRAGAATRQVQSVSVNRTQASIPAEGLSAAGSAARSSIALTTTVAGSGTTGKIPIWISGNTLGNSMMTQSGGKIGVNITAPTSPFTVAGVIQSTIGGFKFPNGAIQSAAGIVAVAHDSTLTGAGTSSSPLGVAMPLALSGSTVIGSALIMAYNKGAGAGVYGNSISNDGVSGNSISGVGVFGGTSSGTGVQGTASGTGLAGNFYGRVEITGDLAVHGSITADGSITGKVKNFKIDHPLEPVHKYLVHAAIESSDMMNLYSGNATLDGNGEAVVQLPEWLSALNKDFRYQLSCIGGFAPVYIAERISNNRFKIAGGKTGLQVSWQVTGIRQDAWATAHPMTVEQEKLGTEH